MPCSLDRTFRNAFRLAEDDSVLTDRCHHTASSQWGLSVVRKLLLVIDVRSEDIVAGKRKRGSMAKGDASLQPGRPDPEREHEDAETLIPGAEHDDLAEELGEESVEAATSGQSSAEDNLNAEVPEETGGPFVVETRRRE